MVCHKLAAVSVTFQNALKFASNLICKMSKHARCKPVKRILDILNTVSMEMSNFKNFLGVFEILSMLQIALNSTRTSEMSSSRHGQSLINGKGGWAL